MGSRLFIGNLPDDVGRAELERLFAPIGEVLDVSIITEWDTGRSRGFGFVQMASAAAAQRAIGELHGSELHGRKLRVVLATPKVPGAAARSAGDAAQPPEEAPASTQSSSPQPRRRSAGRLAAALSLAALIGGAAWLLWPRPAADAHTVLIVPFDVLGQSDGAEYLGYAFAQALAVNLAPAQEFRILPVPQRRELAGGGTAARAATALEAGARRLVLGTLTRRSPMLHASLTLVDAADNRIIWGTQREAHEAEILRLASDLAEEVGEQLGATFPELHAHVTDLTGGPEMSRSPLTAAALAALRRGEITAALEATAALVEAFAADPSAAALRTHALLLRWDAEPSDDNLAALAASVQKLEASGRGEPYASFYRSFIDYRQRREAEAIAGFGKLLAAGTLAPAARAWVLRYRALARQNAADLAGALADLGESLELDPTNAWTLASLSGALEQAGRKEEALERALQALALAPTYWRHHQQHGYVLASLGRWSDAAAAYGKACALGGAQLPCSLEAVALARAGEPAAAERAAEHAGAMVESSWGVYNLACYSALVGAHAEAIRHLRRAGELGLDAGTMEKDPDLASLRDDGQFRALLAELRRGREAR